MTIDMMAAGRRWSRDRSYENDDEAIGSPICFVYLCDFEGEREDIDCKCNVRSLLRSRRLAFNSLELQCAAFVITAVVVVVAAISWRPAAVSMTEPW